MLGAVLDEWPDPDLRLDKTGAQALEAMVLRREAREPLSHILGAWGFWSLDLAVSKDVLTPRPETERLIEIALGHLGQGPLKILDLGTGSGAILLSLLQERPDAMGLAVDRSPAALQTAMQNAQSLKLDTRTMFVEGDWDAALPHGPFDLVVSNPPYIAHDEIATLEPEVRRYEPVLALDGGMDGLDAYRAILPLLPHYIKPGGAFVLEIGADQGAAVSDMAQAQAGLGDICVSQDLGGRDRVVSGLCN